MEEPCQLSIHSRNFILRSPLNFNLTVSTSFHEPGLCCYGGFMCLDQVRKRNVPTPSCENFPSIIYLHFISIFAFSSSFKCSIAQGVLEGLFLALARTNLGQNHGTHKIHMHAWENVELFSSLLQSAPKPRHSLTSKSGVRGEA
jgi:hypothetical protein